MILVDFVALYCIIMSSESIISLITLKNSSHPKHIIIKNMFVSKGGGVR